MMTSERLNQSSDRIRETQRTALDTEEIGVSILQNLHNQRETLLHAHKTELDHGLVQDESFWIPHKHPASLDMSCKRTLMMPNRQKRNPFLPLLHGVDDNIGKSNKILASMSNRNKWWFF